MALVFWDFGLHVVAQCGLACEKNGPPESSLEIGSHARKVTNCQHNHDGPLQAMISLDQLPFEIIEEILFYASSKEKLKLALVCRRLNAIALVHLFRHSCGILEPAKKFVGTTQCRSASHQAERVQPILVQRLLDAFSGLSIAFALDLPSIDTLHISLSSCIEHAHLGLVTEDYHQLLHITKRLEHVRKVFIVFDFLNISGSRRRSSQTHRRRLDQRKPIAAAILNTLLEKGCEELTLYQPSFIPVPWNIGPHTARLLTALQSFISRLGTNSDRVRAPYLFMGGPIRLPKVIRQSSKLQRLELFGETFLYPPLSYWTYCILDAPSLTTLSLCHVYIDKSKWEIILSWLYHPLRHRLIDLTIRNCYTFPIPTLINFFTKFTNITRLRLATHDLDNVNLYHPKGTIGTRPFFPNLVLITAPINWATFLCPETIPRPNLKFINVCLPSFGFGTSVEKLRIFRNPSFQRYHQNHGGSSTVNEEEFECFLDISVEYTADELREDLSLYNDPKTRESGFEVYDCVTGLWVNCNIVPPASGELGMLYQFLGWWKRLRVVRFVSLSPDGSWSHIWTDSKIRDLLKMARVRCPGLREFVIHGKIYRIHEG
ncbi:hypothetical protein BDN72DRAFT_411100 [Pluteus cervinus]|uniref:Uncharacterized protein n=1 Tax=Pluteus cervinus TaxID=181527 RepID=A0ACD3A8Y2_9AGAR|nr:hypothetical protein BDN72DRAFT_411100 [Pluteus cervinus]